MLTHVNDGPLFDHDGVVVRTCNGVSLLENKHAVDDLRQLICRGKEVEVKDGNLTARVQPEEFNLTGNRE